MNFVCIPLLKNIEAPMHFCGLFSISNCCYHEVKCYDKLDL